MKKGADWLCAYSKNWLGLPLDCKSVNSGVGSGWKPAISGTTLEVPMS